MYVEETELFKEEDLKLIKGIAVAQQIDASIKKTLGIVRDLENPYRIKLRDESLYFEIKRVTSSYRRDIGLDRQGNYGGNEVAVFHYIQLITDDNDDKNKRLNFRNNVRSILIQFMCLNYDNRFYKERVNRLLPVSANVIKGRFAILDENTTIRLGFNYKTFVQNMVKSSNWYSFVFGEDDYDIRSYPDSELFDAIKEVLPTQDQKDKFQISIESKNEQKKGIEEGPIPNLEKQNSKNLNDEFNSK